MSTIHMKKNYHEHCVMCLLPFQGEIEKQLTCEECDIFCCSQKKCTEKYDDCHFEICETQLKDVSLGILKFVKRRRIANEWMKGKYDRKQFVQVIEFFVNQYETQNIYNYLNQSRIGKGMNNIMKKLVNTIFKFKIEDYEHLNLTKQNFEFLFSHICLMKRIKFNDKIRMLCFHLEETIPKAVIQMVNALRHEESNKYFNELMKTEKVKKKNEKRKSRKKKKKGKKFNKKDEIPVDIKKSEDVKKDEDKKDEVKTEKIEIVEKNKDNETITKDKDQPVTPIESPKLANTPTSSTPTTPISTPSSTPKNKKKKENVKSKKILDKKEENEENEENEEKEEEMIELRVTKEDFEKLMRVCFENNNKLNSLNDKFSNLEKKLKGGFFSAGDKKKKK